MSIDERILIWVLGFLAGISFGGIVFGDGGGWGRYPPPETPPIVPDYVPVEWSKNADRS
jgi:hypothetical protein